MLSEELLQSLTYSSQTLLIYSVLLRNPSGIRDENISAQFNARMLLSHEEWCLLGCYAVWLL
jgi:hypothetical protein